VQRVRKLTEPIRIRLGSWNVGSLTGKLRELVDAAIRRRVNILCVQEIIWKGQKTKEVEDTGFKLWLCWTKEILSSATSSVLLNGVAGKDFKCKRGVRQGAPFLLFCLQWQLTFCNVSSIVSISWVIFYLLFLRVRMLLSQLFNMQMIPS
jgi:hypothetical protein